MAALTVVQASRSANPLNFVPSDVAGDAFVNSGRELLVVRHTNGAGAAVTLTIETTVEVDGLDVPDRQIVIGPGETHLLGPFPKNFYDDGEGKVNLSWSDPTDVEIAVIKS